MSFCTKCGNEMRDKFCNVCGTAALSDDVTTYLQSLSDNPPAYTPSVRKKNKHFIIAGIAVALVLVIVLGYILTSGHGGPVGIDRRLIGTWEQRGRITASPLGEYGWGDSWDDDWDEFWPSPNVVAGIGTITTISFNEEDGQGSGLINRDIFFNWRVDRGQILISTLYEWYEYEIDDDKLFIRQLYHPHTTFEFEKTDR